MVTKIVEIPDDLAEVLKTWAEELHMFDEDLLDTIIAVELQCKRDKIKDIDCFETQMRKVPLL